MTDLLAQLSTDLAARTQPCSRGCRDPAPPERHRSATLWQPDVVVASEQSLPGARSSSWSCQEDRLQRRSSPAATAARTSPCCVSRRRRRRLPSFRARRNRARSRWRWARMERAARPCGWAPSTSPGRMAQHGRRAHRPAHRARPAPCAARGGRTGVQRRRHVPRHVDLRPAGSRARHSRCHA